MARIEITKDGTKCYYDDDGYLHRFDGPAVIYTNGQKEWWTRGNTLVATTFKNGTHVKKTHTVRLSSSPSGYHRTLAFGFVIWPELK